MKKIILVAFILAAQFSMAQVQKNLGDFNEVKVFDRISVELIPSNENRIEIKGNRSSEVEVVNKNGELKIRMSVKKLMKGEEIEAVLYFKELESIDATEGSYIGCAKTFKQTSIELASKEGGEIKVNLDVQKAKVKAVTGGIIRLTGEALNQDISIGTGGIVEAKELKTAQTTVSITTGGEADVNASDFVDAKVRAGGTITIYGSPKKITEKTVLGGTITKAH